MTADLVLSFIFVIVEAQELQKGASIKHLGPNGTAIDHLDPWYKAFLYIVQVLNPSYLMSVNVGKCSCSISCFFSPCSPSRLHCKAS